MVFIKWITKKIHYVIILSLINSLICTIKNELYNLYLEEYDILGYYIISLMDDNVLPKMLWYKDELYSAKK